MAKALQPADRAPNFSGRDSSTAADRRGPQTEEELIPRGNLYDPQERFNPIQPEHGSHRSGAAPAPEVWRAGSLAPAFSIPAAETSPEGCETQVREIDICRYGDAYDPKSPLRVRDVTSQWSTVDTDDDGSPN